MRCLNSFLRSVALTLTIQSLTSGQMQSAPGLKVGDTSPDIVVKKLLQAPAGVGLDRESLRGNVVVLEFWATWCAPCIAAFPHLNELADEFKDKPVRFIAITSEEGSIVEPFLKRRTMKSWVGLDADRSTMKSYSVKFFPTTVVIDREGRIAIITQPKSITERMLNDLLDRKAINVAKEKTDLPTPSADKPKAPEDVKPLFAVTIKSTQSESYGWSLNPGSFKGRMSLKAALSLMHDILETRIVGPSVLSENRYEITASLAEGSTDDLKQILAKAIETSLRLKVYRETRDLDVFVLTAPQQSQIKLRPNSATMGHWSDDVGVLAASAAPFQALVDGIEAVLKQPVVDDTGLKGKFDWDILFDAKTADSIIDAIRKDLGLELKRARREIEVLVVEMK
jgi:uncharacterized protein (TIGR03435 family)